MAESFPFSCRVALLLGLMLIVSLADYYRNKTEATKFREYGFVIVAGAIGGLTGFINDFVTSSISPDYFILGKGLNETPDLRIQAALFGLRAGISAGVIAGAVCLYASRRKSTSLPLPLAILLRMLWMPLLGAVLCAIVLPLPFSRFDPAHFAAQLSPMLNEQRMNNFREVWWIHIGLYLGMAIGLAVMIYSAVKQRKRGATVKHQIVMSE